ncbi:hypothetical protein GEMRC1_010471 [Eukaryota sp. GEM-RC1]
MIPTLEIDKMLRPSDLQLLLLRPNSAFQKPLRRAKAASRNAAERSRTIAHRPTSPPKPLQTSSSLQNISPPQSQNHVTNHVVNPKWILLLMYRSLYQKKFKKKYLG